MCDLNDGRQSGTNSDDLSPMPASSKSSTRQAQRWFKDTKVIAMPSDYYLHKAERDLEKGEFGIAKRLAENGSSKLLRTQRMALQDIQIAISMAQGLYEESLHLIRIMIKTNPSFYYGYIRKAQFHLIHKEYLEVFETFVLAYKMVCEESTKGTAAEVGDIARNVAEIDRHQADALGILSLVVHELSRAPPRKRAKRFKLAHAISDAYIQVQPLKRRGYLMAAMLYRLEQNRKMVVRICDEGIKNTTGKERQALIEYRSLYDKFRASLVSDDILMRLPKKIVAGILAYLPFKSLTECMEVSDAWYTYIQRLPELFRDITIKREIDVDLLGQALIGIQKLHLKAVDATGMDLLLTLLMEKKFPELREFSTDRCVYTENSRSMVVGLMQVTHLAIINDSSRHVPSLESILELCTELQHLVYYQHYRIPYPPFWEDEDLSRITRLTLGGSEPGYGRTEDYTYVNKLLRKMTNLTFLHMRMDGYKRNSFISVVPTLTTLMVGIFDSGPSDHHDDQPKNPRGLRHMKVIGTAIANQAFHKDIIINANTLETLWVGNINPGHIVDDARDTWAGLSPGIEFPNVTKLTLSFTFQTAAITWLKCFPNLKDLVVYNVKNVTSSLFKAIALRERLCGLTLQWCQNARGAAEENLFGFLTTEMNDGAGIQYLHIDQCMIALEKCLPSIAKLQALRTLKIHNCVGIDRHALADLMDALAESDCLITEFELVGCSQRLPPNDRTLSRVLEVLWNLKSLRLGDLKSITDYTVAEISLLATYRQLERVHIHGCVGISSLFAYMTLGWIPHVKFEK
ncbi:hypothetical protein BJV82DRAFT_659345 [Fennellomyces sp. T-0311]|nr:hypothetical protein BJV82DRAFT_659345 [Fennellomyces sp. T-0311]